MCREAQLIRAWKLLFFDARTFLAQEEGVFSSLNVLLPLYPQTHWTMEKSEFNNNLRSSCILMSSSLKYIVLASLALCEQNSGKFSQYSRKCGAVHRPGVSACELLCGGAFHSLLQTSASLLIVPDSCATALHCDLGIPIHHKLLGV